MKTTYASLLLTIACLTTVPAFADNSSEALPPSAANAMNAQPADTDDDNMCELEDCSDRALLADTGAPVVAPSASIAQPLPTTPIAMMPAQATTN